VLCYKKRGGKRKELNGERKTRFKKKGQKRNAREEGNQIKKGDQQV